TQQHSRYISLPITRQSLEIINNSLSSAENVFKSEDLENIKTILNDVNKLAYPNISDSEKSLTENTNIRFLSFIGDSMTFENLGNHFRKLSIDPSNCEESAEINSLANEIKTTVEKLKKEIENWKSKNIGWGRIRGRITKAILFAKFISREITDERLLETNTIRGSKQHIIQNIYQRSANNYVKVAEKPVGQFSNELLRNLRKEIYFMRKLRECSNILEFYGYRRRPTGLTVILQWADFNLETYLKEHKLNLSEKILIARGIANALNYCHEKNILHYDIRTWSSPEIIRGEEYTKKSEVYSFALVMWAIGSQKLPFTNLREEEIKDNILKGEYLTFSSKHDEILSEYQKIFTKSWHQDPSQRDSMKTILEYLNRIEIVIFLSEWDNDGSFHNITKQMNLGHGIKNHEKKKHKNAWEAFDNYHKHKPDDPHANFWVGLYHLKGYHVDKDVQKGMELLKKASESQHPEAQYLYALTLLGSPTEFEKDSYAIAMKYLRKLALQNDYLALNMLGKILHTGIYGQRAKPLIGETLINKANDIKMKCTKKDC
ncbi:35175_t:CDS:2, partial [Racocetra persica]